MNKKDKGSFSTLDKKTENTISKPCGKKVDRPRQDTKIQNSKDYKPTILGKDGGGGHQKK